MGVALAGLLAVAVGAFLVEPLLRARRAGSAAGEERVPALVEEKVRLLSDLYDLENDFHAGKVSGRDYRRLRAQVEAELSTVLDRLDREWAVAASPEIEAEIAAARESLAAEQQP